MELVVLSIHLLVCICLIGLVLLQRSEGGALGMGGGGGALMSGRGAADALAKMTQVAGGFFLVTSLGLTLLSNGGAANAGTSIFDSLPTTQSAPATPAAPPAAVPEETPDPTESSAPQAAETQLAALSPSTAAASEPTVAPAPTSASARAAPLNTSGAPATTRPATTRSASTPVQTAANTRPTTPPATRSVAIPTPTAAITVDPAQLEPESVEESTGLEAVRRERAGPDQ